MIFQKRKTVIFFIKNQSMAFLLIHVLYTTHIHLCSSKHFSAIFSGPGEKGLMKTSLGSLLGWAKMPYFRIPLFTFLELFCT